MQKYQSYPDYKDSDIEWIGRIPENWNTKPVFALFSPMTKKNADGKETKVLSLSYGQIVERDIETNFGLLPESFNTYQIVECGDIILRLTDLQNDKRSLRVGLVNERGIITSAYLKLASNGLIDSRFAYRLLHSYDTTKVFYGMGGGLRQSMKFEDFRRLPILLPSLAEQIHIADFLDHETAKIDTLIEKQQQLIKLLKEKRQAVISHAVTKGLNPDAPMKDSGVEWLGKVPKHWDVSRIKRVVDIAGRIGYRGYTVDDVVDEGEGAIVLSPSNINERGFTLEKTTYLSWQKYYESPEIMVDDGDILLAKTSWSFGKVAVISKVDSPMTINPQMVLLKNTKLNSKYIWYFLITDALQTCIFNLNTGSYMPTMTQESIGNLPVFIPPKEEVTQIIEHVDGKIFKINSLIDKQDEVIKLLQEKKKALISAAVTGKIDVRNWQSADNKSTEEVGVTA